MMLEFESILDTPVETLDPQVWAKTEDGGYEMTVGARHAIQTAVDYISKVFSLVNPSVRITGSICSNQYTETSDIDVHISFTGLSERNSDELNKALRADFDENYKDMHHHDEYYIGEHPIEVYFQPNPYQDLMSVGCYDFIQNMWLVGPSFKPLDFDPYSEFYSEDMKYVKDIIEDIRNTILQCYEIATVIKGSSDGKFKDEEILELKKKLEFGVQVYQQARQCRKVYSSPTSVEDALQKRESKKWKIADSAFKLMDKFGYLRILKNFSKMLDKEDKLSGEDLAEWTVNIVKQTINVNESVDESMSSFGKYIMIAALLAIPGLLPQEALAKGLTKIPQSEMSLYSPDVQTTIKAASTSQKKYGGYTEVEVVNMIARTLYVEGHSQGTDGRKAILSTILNRSGGNMEYVPAVIREKKAYSCWNKMTDDDWKNFKYKIPTKGTMSVIGNNSNRKIWNECNKLAMELVNGKFKSTIGNRNSYMNPKTADPENVRTWGKKLDLEIKSHKFGYLKEHDPKYVYPGTMNPRTTK